MPSAVDLLFRPELTRLIAPWWQGTHEPGVPPHITVMYPWMDAVTDADLQRLEDVASETPAFEVSFTSVEMFEAGAVYLRPDPDQPIRNLMKKLGREFPESPLYGGAFADPVPHLTIARAEPGAATVALHQRIAASLTPELPFAASVDALAVLTRQPDGIWRRRAELPLGPVRP
ncbi:2'-5' RNA ligase family protein [Microbacterium sp. W4I20]|uniref:2'-5' RNA ligase family protein n=1 Tax=Microbacterium sp. W4I20 TaxID=3042262 RepID=UPI00278A78C5|nr:2'-5' RNA ligase family protein [Microbacterium sp. W4I20]MDQ0727900.1 2'-5' RNA ligase [Microbacterium sp. W4I20]